MSETTTHERQTAYKVFIATSLDGYIARTDGDVEWLISRSDAAGGEHGYEEFIRHIDTIVLGRKSYEKLFEFENGFDQYEGLRMVVLSSGLEDDRVEVYPDLDKLQAGLAEHGARGVYVDGGKVIQSFLRADLIDELTVTSIPVLLGDGIPLFGGLDADISLTHQETKVLNGGFVQSKYTVDRSGAQSG